MGRVFSIVAVAAAVAVVGGCAGYNKGKRDDTIRAKADITGPGIKGKATLYEEYEGRVRIKVKLEGTPESKLKPGLHAIHIQ